MGLKSYKSLNIKNFGTKWDLGVGLMAKHREYYKGEAIMASPMASPDGFPQA
jgi:hypothetical protein